jgi:hypothetical protein
MVLGAKKMPRYLLPAFPMVHVLAGVGLVGWAEQIPQSRVQSPRRRSRISYGLVALGLLLQAALILPRHPYYDTYFNELAGGARAGVAAISTQWQGEGLDIAAQTLNELPDAERQTVGSHKDVFFRQYFVGQTVGVEAPADWYVLGINNVLEGGDKEEERVVDLYRRRRAWDTVAFSGMPYVWVHRAATDPQNPAAFTFESGIRLVGYDIGPAPYHPGQTLRLQLYWHPLEPLAEDFVVFVHMLEEKEDGSVRLVAQQDNPPVRGTRPTSTWEPGVTVLDPYDLSIPRDTPPGDFVLLVGLYRWPDLSRLPVHDDAGIPQRDDRIVLTTVRVEQEPFSFGVWIARVLALLVLLGAVVDLRRGRG